MDLFFDSLPFLEKTRIHFHRFMQKVHTLLKEHAGQSDPLALVAEEWSKEVRIICFDEFLVNDIADAMLLGELLQQLFSRGVSLVATSNVEPGGLYMDGLQRRRFLPAIALLKKHTRTLCLDSPTDYRLRSLERNEIYHHPLGTESSEKLLQSFNDLTLGGSSSRDKSIEVNDRMIVSRFAADDAVWFDFAALCGGPRSASDYIEIAKCYHTVFISDVPQLNFAIDDQARRFINLVDEFYDRNVKLILSVAVPLEELYLGNRLAFEFERTKSRLIEMQSHEFLARPHLC